LSFLDSESKFAVQALEIKVASALPTANDRKSLEHDTVVCEQQQHIKRLSLAATASVIMVGHLQLQLDDVAADLASVEGRLTSALKAYEDKDRLSRDLQTKLDAAVQDLKMMRTQSPGHFQQLESNAHTSGDAQRLKSAHDETKEALDQAEAQLSDFTRTLEEVESQRDSLRLQVTNLQSDLAVTQEELSEAEGRYGTLQAQQLSSMSSSEVARSLQEQIEELEMRVLRRTEQIGIHQHDIKRLETNLRLQEERLGEMTTELETLGEQKEAMVWDCADAREARDEAIQKCEGLELEVEILEARSEKTERERQQEVTALVEVVVEMTVRSRAALDTLKRQSAENDSAAQAQQETLLAVAQVELKSKSALLQASRQAEVELQNRVDVLQEDLTRKIADMKRLEQQLSNRRERPDATAVPESQTMDKSRGAHTEQITTLRKMLDSTANELQEAQALHLDAEVRHRQVQEETNRSKAELEQRLAIVLERMHTEGQLKNELEKVRVDHIREVGRLQEQVRCAEEQLQEVIRSRAELETLYQTTMTDLTRTKEDYEARLSRALDATRQLGDDQANAKFKHAEDQSELEGRLKHSVEETGRLQVQLQEEVERRERERQTHTLELKSQTEACRRAESLEAELHQEIAVTRTQLDQTLNALQALEAEKTALQIETTNLAAEIQRTISLNHFMESEVKAW